MSCILLVCPTNEEAEAFIAAGMFRPVDEDGIAAPARAQYVPGRHGKGTFMLVLASQGEEARGRDRLRFALRELQPILVLVVGIAGGSPAKPNMKQPPLEIGDVVISNRVFWPVKEKTGETQTFTLDDAILPTADQVFTATVLPEMLIAYRESVEQTEGELKYLPKIEVKAYYSSITNVQDKKLTQGHTRTIVGNNDILAVEMELKVVRSEMQQLGREDSPVGVKVISDIVGTPTPETHKNLARARAPLLLGAIFRSSAFWSAVNALRPKSYTNRRTLGFGSETQFIDALDVRDNARAKELTALLGVETALHHATTFATSMCPRCTGGAERIVTLREYFDYLIGLCRPTIGNNRELLLKLIILDGALANFGRKIERKLEKLEFAIESLSIRPTKYLARSAFWSMSYALRGEENQRLGAAIKSAELARMETNHGFWPLRASVLTQGSIDLSSDYNSLLSQVYRQRDRMAQTFFESTEYREIELDLLDQSARAARKLSGQPNLFNSDAAAKLLRRITEYQSRSGFEFSPYPVLRVISALSEPILDEFMTLRDAATATASIRRVVDPSMAPDLPSSKRADRA